MCGFAGIFDLEGCATIDRSIVERMANAIRHRGPDDTGWFSDKGIGIAHRRLSIVGIETGQQPIFNEDKSVVVIFNGELFDYPEQRQHLISKGHQFKTTTDTEIIVHLYEEYGENVFDYLNGQFAFALYDLKARKIILARDRFGICPLHWSRKGNTILFGSEIKALLASGMIQPQLDPKGLDHIFTFFAMGRRRTMFEGVQSILPGHYLSFNLGPNGKPGNISERQYWDFNFPDKGEEDNPLDENRVLDEFESIFRNAVNVRLRADVPVAGYLSGGIDSAAVMYQATQIKNSQLPTFTIQIPHKNHDESDEALSTAHLLKTFPTFVKSGPEEISKIYPDLIAAADCPVVDTTCASLHALSHAVHSAGYKVVLTGEGSDEALAGYIWFKMQKIRQCLDIGPFKPGNLVMNVARKIITPSISLNNLFQTDNLTGGIQAQSILWHSMSSTRNRFYNADFMASLEGSTAYDDLDIDTKRIQRWHPLHQSLYLGYKVFLAGLLLNHKGDRVAMSNSVEARYPFLDEKLVSFVSRLHPRWKLRGLKDKYLLRKTASRWYPQEVAFRPKRMFRAPFGESFTKNAQPYVAQLLSEDSLKKTNYFNVQSVLETYKTINDRSYLRSFDFPSMGLTAVIATQLWHHQNLGGGLCDLPSRNFIK